MTDRITALNAFCLAVEAVKRISLNASTLDPQQYLGGDLGIDSIEMLEIWFRTEKTLGIKIPDTAKRDIYTVGQVLDTALDHMTVAS